MRASSIGEEGEARGTLLLSGIEQEKERKRGSPSRSGKKRRRCQGDTEWEIQKGNSAKAGKRTKEVGKKENLGWGGGTEETNNERTVGDNWKAGKGFFGDPRKKREKPEIPKGTVRRKQWEKDALKTPKKGRLKKKETRKGRGCE